MATLRGEGMATRRERLAKIKKGPGFFVYEGGAVAREWTPTVKRIGRKEPVLDQDGFPVVDQSGRQIYQQSGQPVRVNGVPVLGGPPKVTQIQLESLKIQGVTLPKGTVVEVEDPQIALKMRSMAFVKEVEKIEIIEESPDQASEQDSAMVEDPKPATKRGRPRKSE